MTDQHAEKSVQKSQSEELFEKKLKALNEEPPRPSISFADLVLLIAIAVFVISSLAIWLRFPGQLQSLRKIQVHQPEKSDPKVWESIMKKRDSSLFEEIKEIDSAPLSEPSPELKSTPPEKSDAPHLKHKSRPIEVEVKPSHDKNVIFPPTQNDKSHPVQYQIDADLLREQKED